jgi:hypothetical protein
MKIAFLVAFVFASVAAVANAQVLTTADTIGRAKQGVLVSENRIFVDGVRLHIAVAQYVRGISDRFDIYLVAGVTRTDDEPATAVLNQVWLGAGGNWSVGQWKGFRASLFGLVSTPITRRDQASVILANPAVVVSRAIVKDRLALYTGVNALVPIGHPERGWFTPATAQVNVPAGALIMLGKWGVFGEADVGHLKAVGFGLARTL